MRSLSRSRFSAMALFSPPKVEVRWKAAGFQGKDGGRRGFLNPQGPETSEKRNTVCQHRGRKSSRRTCVLLSQALMVSIVRRRTENGGSEESRLRNHRRKVAGSATRSGSLTVGAAVSQRQP